MDAVGVWGGLAVRRCGPEGAGTELLVNPQFNQLDPANSLKPLGWESTEGWEPFSGYYLTLPWDRPSVVGNGPVDWLVAFGHSPSSVVFQNVELLPGVGASAASFTLQYSVSDHIGQPNEYWVEAQFLNGTTVVATLRSPGQRTQAAPAQLTTYTLELRRDASASFDQITAMRVSLFGRVTPGGWGDTMVRGSTLSASVSPRESRFQSPGCLRPTRSMTARHRRL